jgi:hypothetical protein
MDDGERPVGALTEQALPQSFRRGANVSFTVVHNAFASEEEARQQALARGFNFIRETRNKPVAEDNPLKGESHFHDFDTLVFIVEGSLDFVDHETGLHHVCGPGTRVEDIGHNRHAESHMGFRALTAYRVDPETLEMPYVRPASLLA